ncbi:hypothetical protein [Sebaldella termitidis]|uniref:hypothetical protein n=1 Tax=Sebaldella termitidis TaxID=826 RepID=UPI003EC05B44
MNILMKKTSVPILYIFSIFSFLIPFILMYMAEVIQNVKLAWIISLWVFPLCLVASILLGGIGIHISSKKKNKNTIVIGSLIIFTLLFIYFFYA